jgi:hypothetical protein
MIKEIKSKDKKVKEDKKAKNIQETAQVAKEQKNEEEEFAKLGVNQKILNKEGVEVKLSDILSPEDSWQSTGKIKRTILTHGGVQKIADIAGVSKLVGYKVLTQPDAYNNYQYTIEATVRSEVHGEANEWGEANRSNLGTKGRGNPANMAQKRAYDRAVFRLLNIRGLLSEEELSDDNTVENKNTNTMENEIPDFNEQKEIAPLINQLLLVKNKKDLAYFGNMMKEKVPSLKENQLSYLRKLYEKKAGELSDKTF